MFVFGLICFFSQGPSLQMVEQLMAFKQYWGAYEECSKYIEFTKKKDQRAYLLRAICALEMGMSNETIHDANHVLTYSLKDDEKKEAYRIRFNGYMQCGNAKSAENDANTLKDVEMAKKAKELSGYLKKIEKLVKSKDIDQTIDILDRILDLSPRSIPYVMKRADIAWNMADTRKYCELVLPISSRYQDDGDFNMKLGICMFCDGKIEESRVHVQKFRRIPGTPKNVSKVFKIIGDVNRDFHEARKGLENSNVTAISSSLESLTKNVYALCTINTSLSLQIEVLRAGMLRIEGVSGRAMICLNDIILRNPGCINAYVERGLLNLQLGEYDAAIYDFSSALSQNPGEVRSLKGLEEAREKKRKEQFIDLYAIVGVTKEATNEEISVSYKGLVRKWHPDQYSDPKKKEEAEKMMKKINAAYEILIDGQKRKEYDNGSDYDNPNMFFKDLFKQNFGWEEFFN